MQHGVDRPITQHARLIEGKADGLAQGQVPLAVSFVSTCDRQVG